MNSITINNLSDGYGKTEKVRRLFEVSEKFKEKICRFAAKKAVKDQLKRASYFIDEDEAISREFELNMGSKVTFCPYSKFEGVYIGNELTVDFFNFQLPPEEIERIKRKAKNFKKIAEIASEIENKEGCGEKVASYATYYVRMKPSFFGSIKKSEKVAFAIAQIPELIGCYDLGYEISVSEKKIYIS